MALQPEPLEPPRTIGAATIRRFAAVALSALLPGVGQVVLGLHRRRRVWVMWAADALALVTLAVVVAHAGALARWAAQMAAGDRLLVFASGAAVVAVVRWWSVLDAAWYCRVRLVQRPWWREAGSAVLVVVLAVTSAAPAGALAWYVAVTDHAVGKVFASAEPRVAQPSTNGAAPDPAVSNVTVPKGPWSDFDRLNIVLLGGDAGQGRYSLRTDSMVLLSIDPQTGDTAMISVPRDVIGLPQPPGSALAAAFPTGFEDLANSLYTYVGSHPDLAPGTSGDGPAEAIKASLAEFLGVPIQYFVLADMRGFVDVIDALGGVTITVHKTIPMPGNPASSKHTVPDEILPGVVHMDGTLALGYARSREADSDYQRMLRQRCVLAAVSKQADALRVATAYPSIVAALGDHVRTDIPRGRLPDLLDLVQLVRSHAAKARSMALIPPVLDPVRWKLPEVRALVAQAIALPSPEASTTTAEPATTEPATTLPGRRATTSEAVATTISPVSELGDVCSDV